MSIYYINVRVYSVSAVYVLWCNIIGANAISMLLRVNVFEPVVAYQNISVPFNFYYIFFILIYNILKIALKMGEQHS